jgi:O-antigen/teichoic acid export membrane protein
MHDLNERPILPMTYAHDADRSDAETAGLVPLSSPRSIKTIVAGVWSQHQDLLRNVGSLLATTGVTSVLGAAYWTFAARIYAQSSVGYAAAEIPVMTLLGTIGMLGLGTLMVGELPNAERRAELASAALIVCSAGSTLLGIGFAFIAPLYNQRFAALLGPPDQKLLFVVGVMLTSVTMVFDMATIGLMRGGIQLARNIAFSIIKLVALPLFALLLHDQFGVGIVLSWTAGIGLSLSFIAVRMVRSGTKLLVVPDWLKLRSLGRTAMAHNWLEIAISAPPAAFPVLTTLLVSPSANAAFYVAYTLAGVVYMVPSHLSTVLFAMAAAEPEAIAHRVRFATKLSYAIGLPVVAVLVVGGHWILGIYGPGYASVATVPMALVALGYLPSVPKALYIAICRANGRTTFVAVLLSIFTVLEIGGAVVGGIVDGLDGLALGILLTLTAQGLFVTPPILRTVVPGLRLKPASPTLAYPGAGPESVAIPKRLSDTGWFLADLAAYSGNAYKAAETKPHERLDTEPATSYDLAELAAKGSAKERQDAGVQALITLAQSVSTTGGFGRIP